MNYIILFFCVILLILFIEIIPIYHKHQSRICDVKPGDLVLTNGNTL